MTKEIEKLILKKMRNAASWRRSLAIDSADPRDAQAARLLDRLADSEPTKVAQDDLARVQGHRDNPRFEKILLEAIREIGFRCRVTTLPDFVAKLAARLDVAFGS